MNQVPKGAQGFRPDTEPKLKDAKATPIHSREDWIQDSDGSYCCDWYMEGGYDVRCRD